MTRLLWVLSFVGALAGAGMLALTLLNASGAPQEAAGAALACGFALVPYVLARSLESLGRGPTVRVIPEDLARPAPPPPPKG